jgi:hypothetical protein
MAKPILCLDFDGVIHSYSSGWKGADVIPDPPVPGALPFIVAAMKEFTVAIYSSRSGQPGGIKAMIEWLGYWSVDKTHGMPGDFDHGAWSSLRWPTEKPPAMVTLDDRALTFNGKWPSIESLQAFQPWNKREYPQGQLNTEDEGALKLAVGSADGVVRVDFGKPVAWLGLPPAEAVQFARLILRHAGAKVHGEIELALH